MDANETAWMNNDDIPATSVRDCIPGDLSAVISPWSVSGICISPSDSEEEIELTGQRNPDLFLVAEFQGRAIGAVHGRFDRPHGWINHLAVHPSFRSSVVGTLPVDELEKRLFM